MAPKASTKPQTIDIGDLTAAVTESVQRAMTARKTSPLSGRIIIGIIFEPAALTAAERETAD